MKLRFLMFTVTFAAWGLAHPVLSQQAPQQPPRFMAGVDLMRLKLTVLDKHHAQAHNRSDR
jgi:hypothetical protein